VIGMKVVLADGSLIKVGGRVVKNVAGYDLCKLFTGSYGTLGVIVEVNFKLRPRPFQTSTTMAWGDRDKLLAGAQKVIASRLFPVAVELLSPELGYEVAGSEGTGHLLLLRFAGSAIAVAEQTRAAVELLAENVGQALLPVPPASKSDDTIIWGALAALPTQFREDFVWRVNLPPANLGSLLEKLERDAGQPQFRWHAGIGDGRIRVAERLQPAENGSAPYQSDTVRRIEALRQAAQGQGGTLVIEHADTTLKNQIDVWGSFGSTGGLQQRIKEQLDPATRLSPGRFEFGATNRAQPHTAAAG